MLLSGSIESETTMEILKNVKNVHINRYIEFLPLYGLMLLSGSVDSDKHNAAILNFEKRSDK